MLALARHPGEARTLSLRQTTDFSYLTVTRPGPTVAHAIAHLDRSTPGESRGRKATGPRLLPTSDSYELDAPKDPKTAALPDS